MTSQLRVTLCGSLFLLAAAGWLWSESTFLQAAAPAEKKDAPLPVEPDMHEFMEYVFQPSFKRLKPAMAAAPTDNAGWKTIKAESLTLAESGNLLLLRPSEEDATDWVKHSLLVRDFGGQLYRSAKAKDYPTARKHYETMLQHCNACHHQFAGGEHILAP